MSAKEFSAAHTTSRLSVSLSALLCLQAFAAQPYVAPHTEFGYPDLQGVWTNATITRLSRPPQYGNRRAHTAQEAAALEKDIADSNAATSALRGEFDIP
jgi:hypothetical protein